MEASSLSPTGQLEEMRKQMEAGNNEIISEVTPPKPPPPLTYTSTLPPPCPSPSPRRSKTLPLRKFKVNTFKQDQDKEVNEVICQTVRWSQQCISD